MFLLGVESPILSVDFNQDFTCLCIGSKFGYTMLLTTNDQENEAITINSDPICMVERLFTSSLVALVSLGNLRKLLAYHFRRNALICEYQYTQPILAVKMNRQRLVVCVENEIFVHNIRDMELLHTVENTPPNRSGVIALSSSPDIGYMAYPGSQSTGTVFIFDTLTFTNVVTIAAHNGLLATLTFNSSSSMLATASERGTVVRVFAIPNGEKIMEFRRGLARCAAIGCLSFSLDSQFLVSASNTETVHIFKLYSRTREACSSGNTISLTHADNTSSSLDSENTNQSINIDGQAGWSGGLINWVGDTIKATAAYLPYQVTEVLSQDRAFAFARIPSHPASLLTEEAKDSTEWSKSSISMKKVAALICNHNQYHLLVAGLDNQLHTFSFDHICGGEAKLLHSRNLFEPNPNHDLSTTNANKIIQERCSDTSIGHQSMPDDCPTPNKQSTFLQNKRCFASVCAQELLTPTEKTAVELSDAAASTVSKFHAENESEFPDIQTAIKIPQKRAQNPPKCDHSNAS